MDCEKKDSDLEEDSELEALRLAALATLKTRANNLESTHSNKDVSPPKVPSTLSSVPYNRKEQVPGSLPKGQYLWKSSSNQQRRGRGRGVFPKANQRSNLIVITPVSTDENDPKEGSRDYKASKPQLSLPQHRWCQSVNEDSSSPKTYSKRGPTRFNRHESSSESSDSDYDNSDNDSYSNETILQDENSANFSQQTPEESIEGESTLKTRISSDRRLSFQNTNLDKLQGGAEVSRDTYHRTSNDDKTMLVQSDSRVARESDSTNYSSNKRTSNKSETLTVNGGSQLDADYDKTRRRPSYLEEPFSGNGTATVKEEKYTDDPKLTQNDLRLELKKRMLKLRSENAELIKSEKFSSDKQVRNAESESDDNQRRCVRDSDRTHDHSRSDRTSSSEKNRSRLRSSSPRNRNRKRSQSHDRHTESENAWSPVRKYNREPSQSPDRNGKRSWSRSPVKRHRSDSFSPDQKNRHDYSRSPSKTHTPSIAPQSNVRSRNSSHSPNKSRKRTLSPDRNFHRDRSSSPNKSYKGSTLRSLDPKKEDSRIPYKSNKGSPAVSPQLSLKEDKSGSLYKSRKSSVTRSPKLKRGQSPDKNFKRLSPQIPERKPKQKISWSPERTHKRNSSQSPKRKREHSRRNRSRSPVHAQKTNSPSSLEKSLVRKRDKYSRYCSSRSSRSSSLSSRSSTVSSSSTSSPCVRSISSVIKPVQSNVQPQVQVSVAKPHSSPDSDFTSSVKKGKHLDEKPKSILSLVKSSIVVGENRNNVSDSGKRLPVHMRLGTLPRNKLIRMTKDVEAAFVNSSSEDDANVLVRDGKKQNFRVVAEVNKSDISKRRVEKSPSKFSLDSKRRKKKAYR